MNPLGRLLPAVMPGERVRTQYATLALASVAAAAILARAAGTTLFLDAFDARLLPWMYAATAGLVVLASLSLASLMHRWRPDRVLVGASITLAAGCVLVRLGIGHGDVFSAVAYVLADGIARILVVLFWAFAALLFNAREARRVVPLLTAAGTVACFAAAAWIPALTAALGVRNLLVPAGLLVACFAVAVKALMRREPSVASRFKSVGSDAAVLTPPSSNMAVLRVPHVRNLTLLVAVGTLALHLNDYAFIRKVRTLHSGDDLASFLGVFFAIASALALAVQLLVLPTLLRRGGVLAALMVLPAGLLVVTAGVALTGSYALVLTGKLLEPVLLFTVDAAAIHLLYHGLRKRNRFRARSLVEGVGRPAAIAFAAICLLAGASALDVRSLAWWTFFACIAWLFLARRAVDSYVRGLTDLLGARSLDPSEDVPPCTPGALAEQLRTSLRTAPDAEVPYILALLESAPGDWSEGHAALLQRTAPALQVAGLEYLRRHPHRAHAEGIAACLRAGAPAVRVAAIRACAALRQDGPTARYESLLQDEDVDVRANAAAALAGATVGATAATSRGVLRSMLRAGAPEVRAAGVRALGTTAGAALVEDLRNLLGDHVVAVRLATLRTLAQGPVRGLAVSIVPLLSDPETAIAARDALVAAGSDALLPLEEEARSSLASMELRQQLPGVLAHLGPDAIPAIEVLMQPRGDARDREVCRRAIRACCDVVRAWPSSPGVRQAAERAALREAESARSLLHRSEAVNGLPGTAFLSEVLMEEHEAHLDDCLLLLGAARPEIDGLALRQHVRSGTVDERAESIELLANVLGPELREPLLALLEQKADTRAPQGRGGHGVVHDLARESGPEWIVAGAVHACRSSGTSACLELVEGALSHASPMVRETALHAFVSLAHPAEAQHHARILVADADPAVRRLATQVAGSAPAR